MRIQCGRNRSGLNAHSMRIERPVWTGLISCPLRKTCNCIKMFFPTITSVCQRASNCTLYSMEQRSATALLHTHRKTLLCTVSHSSHVFDFRDSPTTHAQENTSTTMHGSSFQPCLQPSTLREDVTHNSTASAHL